MVVGLALIALVAVAATWNILSTDEAPVAVAPATTTAPTTTTEPPPPTTEAPDRWLVEVAVATPAALPVWRERPPDPPEGSTSAAADGAATTGPETTTTSTTAPTTTLQPGVVPLDSLPGATTLDDHARAAAFRLLQEDADALEPVGPDDPPPPAPAMAERTLELNPAAEALVGLGAMEATTDRRAPAGPAPQLPRERSLTPIPSPGLSWGAEATDEGWTFTNPTPSGNARVFLVTDRVGEWVKVVLPTRPQHEGWVRRSDVVVSRHRWHVDIDVSDNVLRVWEGDRLELETLIVDGRASTPTPLGRFYLNERVAQSPGTFYAPWILSTNAFSDTLERFSGEVPIFALHGGGYENTIGSSISNGCIRIPPDVVERMGEILPMGTPIDVHA